MVTTTMNRGDEGFRPLFDGKTLRGWDVVRDTLDSWEIQDGVVVCNGAGRGWLRTERMYRDFVLRLEFAISPQGNSGVFLRSLTEGRPAYNGLEVQILDDHGASATTSSTGALYDAIAPTKNVMRAVWEWNELEARCIGTRIQLVLNGEPIVDVDLEEHDVTKGRPREGYIGLQNHHSPVKFRSVRVLEV